MPGVGSIVETATASRVRPGGPRKEFPPFHLDPADQSLWRGDQRIHLTPKAFAVLQYLLDRAGRLVTQSEMLEAVWPDTFVQPEVLKSQILDIRAALGDRHKDPLYIETVPRRGYRFIAGVRQGSVREPSCMEPASKTLVGREKALQDLRACLHRAQNGDRQIVFVTGEQGMGKTTVLEEFLQEPGVRGAQLARGQSLEGYGTVKEPYYPVLEALGQMARAAEGDTLTRVLETYAPTWLIQLPALLTREHRDTLQRELVGATRERMIREICEALERLAETETLVLVFEDLHWTDHATVDLIAAVAHRRSPAHLLIIGTYRPVDVVITQHPLKQVTHALKAHRLSREIALSPLGECEVVEYLSCQAGNLDSAGNPELQDLARWICKQTEGNPLFMVTVVEHLVEQGYLALNDSQWRIATPLDQIEVAVPDTLRQMIELQIDRLSPREHLALDAASVQGQVFSSEAVAAALEIDLEAIEDTCQNLARHHHIVRVAAVEPPSGGPIEQRYEFVHAAFRHVFYHRLPPARRAKLHRRFGEAMEAMCPGDRSGIAVELAGHFELCGDWPRVMEYLWLAAQSAWQRLAYREALATLEHALRLAARLPEPERARAEVRILDCLAVLQLALHDTGNGMLAMETLVKRAAASSLPEVEAHGLAALAMTRATEDCRACVPLIERMEALAARQDNPSAQARACAQHASMRIANHGWDADLERKNANCTARVLASGDRLATALVLSDRSYVQWASSNYADSLRSAEASLPVLLEAGRFVRYLQGRDLMAMNLAFLGQWGKSLDILDQEIEEAHRNEAPLRLLLPLLFKAWVHLQALDFSGALEICESAQPSLAEPFMRNRQYLAIQFSAAARLGLGDHRAPLTRLLELGESLDQCPVVFSWYWRMPLQLAVAEAWLARGDLAKARAEADHAIEAASRTAEHTWQALAWETSIRVALQEGDASRTRQDLEKALQAMQGFDVPLAGWRVHATAAAVYGRCGEEELANRHLDCSRGVISALARSLDTRPSLQRAFLESPSIAGLQAR